MRSLTITAALVAAACTSPKESATPDPMEPPAQGTFGYDAQYVAKYRKVHILSLGEARVLVVPDFQGRVMTSSLAGESGDSYGWINYSLIHSGVSQPHINPYGGEDRFWIGPEGGQYAVFFRKGDPFDFEHWLTPAIIDTEPFDVESADSLQITFTRKGELTNYAGSMFFLDIWRRIRMVDSSEVSRMLGAPLGGLDLVAFESDNKITNAGTETWSPDRGLLSIWILGMFNPSDQATVVVPVEKPGVLTDDYFGKVPPDRLVDRGNTFYFRGDGKMRRKIGITPDGARNIAGSYDAKLRMLTLVKFDLDPAGKYLSSKWEQHEDPYSGDAFNAYNDGPLEGGSQLGPFYELESSSPSAALAPGESLRHRHLTVHVTGNENQLNRVANAVLGVSLREIETAFDNSK
jgi:hypothetical protein